jgi:NAD(P)-dependent dehydrogenase (short-subunit alcohol dehydrogenase family)
VRENHDYTRPMADRFTLEGKTAVVTGGSRGIGLEIARAFIDAGARVVLTARGEEALNQAVRSLGPNAIAKQCDNADPAQIAYTVAEAWRLGPVDILVNNAGISPFYKRAELVEVDEFSDVMDVNVRGTYFWCVEVARRLFEANQPGSIINVSSVAAQTPLERLGVYAASKAAVEQMTKVMALEWADRNVRVNAIAPGWTETDFTGDLFESRHGEGLRADVPLGRLARPDEIAAAALYLASEASSYVTGTVLVVDGGRALR